MGKRSYFNFGIILINLIIFEPNNCLGFDCNSEKTVEDEYNPEYIAKCRHLHQSLPIVQETIDLLNKGDEQIVLNDAYKDVVFMIGNTGSGKSTAVQWLIGDEDELVAVEIGEESGNFIIEDKHSKIGNSTITSQTIFPDLIVDFETNVGFYDFSGFRDTRSTSHDIATSYFIKKIVNFVDSIKIVVVVNYPSVRVGVDRQDFTTLLKHLTEELLNLDKYKNSIALLVTKVDNNEKIFQGDYIPIDDQTEIESIALFLEEVQTDFKKRLRNSEIKASDHTFYTKSNKLIDILLMKSGKTYRNIGLFRRPDEEGPLSNNKQLREGRNYFRDIIFNKLEFVEKNKNDFGYTISEKSMNEVKDIMREIHKNMLSIIYSIANKVNDYYAQLFEEATSNLKSLQVNITIDTDLSNVKTELHLLIEGYDSLSKLVSENINVDILNLATVINNTLTSLNISVSSLSELHKQSKYLEFLEEVSGKKIDNSQTWVIPFSKIVLYLNTAKTEIENDINNIEHMIDTKIRTAIMNEINKLKTYFYSKEDSYKDIQDVIAESNLIHEKLSIISDTDEPQKLVENLKSIKISNYSIHFSHSINSKILNENKYFIFLKNELNNAALYFSNSQKWYTFLKKIFFKLSTYEIQVDKNKCGKLLNGITDTDFDIKVTDTGLEYFLTHCAGTTDIDTVKDLTIDPIKYKALLKVLDVTLGDHNTQDCVHDGKLLIKGNFITFSGINFNRCPTNIKSIQIFALHKVFIDRDLDKTGQNIDLSIVAPTWEVIGDIKITLDGAAGKAIVPAKARNGDTYGENGANGKAGNPGGPGGNFLGQAAEIINDWRLKISSNGGNGGPGQHGGDGFRGENGELPTISEQELSHFVLSGTVTKVIDRWVDKGFTYTTETYRCIVIHTCVIYNVHGKRCGDGGNGGLGGHGGLGGNPGLVKIEYQGSGVRVSADAGNTGVPGNGGRGGNAGVGGGDITVKEIHKWIILKVKQWYILESVTQAQCNAGKSPLEINKNNNFIQHDSPRTLNELSIKEDFNKFLESNANNIVYNKYRY